jgi:predicted helicase
VTKSPVETIQSLQSVLNQFREAAYSKRDMGDKFERLIAGFLKTDSVYSDLFEDVWLWSEWPERSGMDTGIDLVARERNTGEYWGIQVKFYLPETTIGKGDVDSFLNKLGQKPFIKGLFVSTTDKWGKNAEESLHNIINFNAFTRTHLISF